MIAPESGTIIIIYLRRAKITNISRPIPLVPGYQQTNVPLTGAVLLSHHVLQQTMLSVENTQRYYEVEQDDSHGWLLSETFDYVFLPTEIIPLRSDDRH